MSISEGHYNYLKRRINDLERQLRDVTSKLDELEWNKQKRWLDFEEIIPPKSVCVDALSMLEDVGNYRGVLRLLSDYYGLEHRMEMLHDPQKVQKGAVACYHRGTGKAYGKEPVSPETVLHEFFHFLHDKGVVYLYEGQDEEELATKYAANILERAQR